MLNYEYRKSKNCSNASPVYVSDYMTGKMENIPAISTNCLVNPICLERMQQGDSVCAQCFAAATESQYKKLNENTTYNYNLLTAEVLPMELLPHFNFNVNMVRIEAFGDLGNELQAINYINIVRKNKHVHFAWWTKNPWFIADAIAQGYELPNNVEIVFSVSAVNGDIDIGEIRKVYPFISKVFIVYEKKYAEDNDIETNCAGLSCASCGRCYFSDEEYIRELLRKKRGKK